MLDFAQVRRVEIACDGASFEFDSLILIAAEDELPLPDHLVGEKRGCQREVDEIDCATRFSLQCLDEPIHYGAPGAGRQQNSNVEIACRSSCPRRICCCELGNA